MLRQFLWVGAASLLLAGAYEAFRAWRESPVKVNEEAGQDHGHAGPPAELPPPKPPPASSSADHVQKFVQMSRKARWHK